MPTIWSSGGDQNSAEWIMWGGVGFGSVQADSESGEEVQRRLGMGPPVETRIRCTPEFFPIDGGDMRGGGGLLGRVGIGRV
jgi:hypothetical protein